MSGNLGSLVGSSRDLAPGARAAELVSYDDGEGSGRVLVSEGNHRRKKQRIVVFKPKKTLFYFYEDNHFS